MNVGANTLGICGEEVGFGWLQPGIHDDRFHVVVDPVQVLEGVDVGDVAAVEDVVDVLQEDLAFDLHGWRERGSVSTHTVMK